MRPGSLLTRKLLEWACGTELRVFDFGVGDEPYKDRWCDSTLPLWDHLAPVTLSGRAYVAQMSAMRSAKRIVDSSPALSRVVPIIKRAMYAHAGK
jgi:CelD/BcsL family acetyltransferase involved in cellulose biosynthesis